MSYQDEVEAWRQRYLLHLRDQQHERQIPPGVTHVWSAAERPPVEPFSDDPLPSYEDESQEPA